MSIDVTSQAHMMWDNYEALTPYQLSQSVGESMAAGYIDVRMITKLVAYGLEEAVEEHMLRFIIEGPRSERDFPPLRTIRLYNQAAKDKHFIRIEPEPNPATLDVITETQPEPVSEDRQLTSVALIPDIKLVTTLPITRKELDDHRDMPSNNSTELLAGTQQLDEVMGDESQDNWQEPTIAGRPSTETINWQLQEELKRIFRSETVPEEVPTVPPVGIVSEVVAPSNLEQAVIADEPKQQDSHEPTIGKSNSLWQRAKQNVKGRLEDFRAHEFYAAFNGRECQYDLSITPTMRKLGHFVSSGLIVTLMVGVVAHNHQSLSSTEKATAIIKPAKKTPLNGGHLQQHLTPHLHNEEAVHKPIVNSTLIKPAMTKPLMPDAAHTWSWAVADTLSPQDPTLILSSAITRYSEITGQPTKLIQRNGSTWIEVNGHIINQSEMSQLNRLM
jgi:hypothetical protein